jgi:hypothetical protein
MTMKPCTRRTLAAGELAVVEHCSCGAVHVTIGAVTLRLAAGAIAPLATTMNEAARRLLRDPVLNVSEARGEVLS